MQSRGRLGDRTAFAASAIGAAALGWTIGKFSSLTEIRDLKQEQATYRRWCESQICRGLGLLTPEQAQRTQAVRLECLLTEDDISELLAFARSFWDQQLPGHTQREREQQVREKGSQWRTAYLHTGDLFYQRFPSLYAKIRRAIFEADEKHWQILKGRDPARLNFRTIECHEYGPAGRLSAEGHYDAGSLLTLDIMLSDPTCDFKGGDLVMPEANGLLTNAKMRKGDAMLFMSHKYHNVLPVVDGQRAVFVVELWDGPKRTCPHRCESVGPCPHSLHLTLKQ
eukprot:TRINITY_DN19023_c0_g1_i1.p1 TRINITY_DN19023_c0_g1~~TRINITY_DN19023_c0_g1_i1.p1  ORF type:complete len:317 (-),score=18.70 TRINITY_DN19023_c0_g1_i1:165-1010(-)